MPQHSPQSLPPPSAEQAPLLFEHTTSMEQKGLEGGVVDILAAERLLRYKVSGGGHRSTCWELDYGIR